MTLESHLPTYDFSEVRSTSVRASPEATLAAARALTPCELPLTVALMAVRGLPALLARGGPSLSLRRPVIEQFERAGFAVLSDTGRALVVGVTGRFWRPGGGLRPLSAAEFAAFDEPGYAKAAFDFRVTDEPGGKTRLTTETRIACTDAAARRDFGRYWRLVSIGSGLIRREWLWAARRRAEG